MKKKIVSTVLSTALILTALPAFASSSPIKENSSEISSVYSQDNTVKEVPNMKIVDGLYDPGEITLFSLLLNTTYNFSSGQGTGSFAYKAGSSREKVRVHVSNNKNVAVNYRLTSPTGTDWVSLTVKPGSSVTTEHYFDKNQAGTWILNFDTNDGSPVSVNVSVRDGLQ
ncbi:hypothetical protein B4V02_01230 [Paenibacillus kribbensis]|uniref:Uncharacterized protein n=1 Tax=Paenibacillus kribbensis TaxID=172713 RepID=A0A222WGX3_9BACL|nr:hypothetical protein [Paenibacillus kribbensis]ASR45425.1 hypothetical protein B4V02_01230 [Paenibacillus kribbensis]